MSQPDSVVPSPSQFIDPDEFDELVESNEVPDEKHIAGLEGYMHLLEKRVSEKDAELQSAIRVVMILSGQHASLQSTLRGTRAVLHPIRGIPADILQSIASHLVASPEDVMMTEFDYDTRTPLLDPVNSLDTRNTLWAMSQVCRHWRQAIVGAPSLWSTIIVPMDFASAQLDKAQLAVVQGQIFLLEQQLERARSYPLTMLCWSTDLYELDPPYNPLLAVVASHMSSAQNLRIRIPRPATVKFLNRLDLQNLQWLFCHCHVSPFSREPLPPFDLVRACSKDRLRCVDLGGSVTVGYDVSCNVSLLLPESVVRYRGLVIAGPAGLQTLSGLNQLQELTICCATWTGLAADDNPIYLPVLRRLYVALHGSGQPSYILRVLHAPLLCELAIRASHEYVWFGIDSPFPILQQIEILHLHFDLALEEGPLGDDLDLLQWVPGVESLTICTTSFEIDIAYCLHHWPNVLPCLQSLRLLGNVAVAEMSDHVIDIIASRRSQGCRSVLRSVTLSEPLVADAAHRAVLDELVADGLVIKYDGRDDTEHMDFSR